MRFIRMRIFFFGVFCFLFFVSKADTGFTPRLAQAYRCLYKLKLDSAQILINKNVRLEPDNQVNTLIYCYVEFIRILLSEDRFVYSQWQNRFDLRINSVKEMEENSPFRNYILGEMYIQSSLLKLKFDDQIGALMDFRKGYNFLADNEKEFPSFMYHKKSLGFIHILLSFIPNKYKWIVRLTGFSTDFEKGKKQLAQSFEADIVVNTEAFFLQTWLSIVFDDNSNKGIQIMKDFIESHPDFVVAKWSLVMQLKNINKVDEALAVSNEVQPHSGYYYSPYFYFVKGQMYLLVGNYAQAILEMKQFLANYQGKMLRQSAFYNMYLSEYLSRRIENLAILKDSVLQTSLSGSIQDRMAQKALMQNDKPTIEILKAKLFFDAGHFKESLDELNQLDSNVIGSLNEKVEYLYRKARALEKLNQITEAFEFYKLAIHTQQKEPLYFAPNAYLLMAKILIPKNPALAKSYLKKIEDYDDYEYQPEIEYQAKALLKKL